MKDKNWLALNISAIIFSIICLTWILATEASAMTVWTDHATVKIRQKTTPKIDQTSATLKAAKNEFESFQLIVTADGGNLNGVDVNVSNLIDTRGNSISSNSIMIYKEAFINITTISDMQGAAGPWPDALIPKKDEYVGEVRNAFPLSVTAGQNQPIWIEIYVPPTTVAGIYSGSATVTATGQTSVVVPIQLTVWDFSLPSTSSLKSAFAIDYHVLPQGHGLTSTVFSPTNTEHIRLTQLYAKANLLHRVSDSLLPGPQAMGGMTGSAVNWAAFDTAFGPFFDGTVSLPGKKLPGNKMTSYQMSFYSHETDIPFLRGVAQHFKTKGWFDRLYQYTCDEPPFGCAWSTIATRAQALHQADPDLRTMVTASLQNATAGGVADYIDLFSPTIRYMDDKFISYRADHSMVGNQRSKYGPETWWYQACGSHGCGFVGGDASDPQGYNMDWPATMIDLPAMFSRIMEWESFKYNIQGEVYYEMVYAYGAGDPWVSQRYFGGNGDGTLYYPGKPSKIGGTQDIPIESIRLKLIREGQEDYEYMHLLKVLGEEAYAQEQVGTIVTNTYTWDRDPLNLYTAREKMAARIVAHVAAGVILPTPPPPATAPEPIVNNEIPQTPGTNSAPGNIPPTAAIVVTVNATDPLTLSFDGATSHAADGSIISYIWNFGDGNEDSIVSPSHHYAATGTYSVTLSVTDAVGASDSTSIIVSVTNVAHAPVAAWSATTNTPFLYAFDASASDGGSGTLTEYRWDFGDLTIGAGQKVDHLYTAPGTYQVELTVVNDAGKSATATWSVEVLAATASAVVGNSPAASSGGGGGGGCGMLMPAVNAPIDIRQAISYLLLVFSPFGGLFWRNIKRKKRPTT